MNNSQSLIFILDRMPWENEETIRICVPSVDSGSAVFFEAKMGRRTKGECEKLLPGIRESLAGIQVTQ